MGTGTKADARAENWLTKIWKAQAELNQAIAEMDGSSNQVKWAPMRRMEDTPLVACECGVAITGGLCSDWCPLYEKPGV